MFPNAAVQNQKTSFELDAVANIISELRDFDRLTEDSLLNGLNKLIAECHQVPQLEAAESATLATLNAFTNRLSLTIDYTWLSWPTRIDWIEAEFALASDKGSATTLRQRVEVYRSFYRWEEDTGYPENLALHYQKELRQKQIAYARVALFELGADLESASIHERKPEKYTTALNFCRPFSELDNDSAGAEFSQAIQKIKFGDLSAQELNGKLWTQYAEAFNAINASAPDTQFHSLKNLPENKQIELLRNLRIMLYDANNPAPEKLWEVAEASQKAWSKLSPNFPVFEISTLKKLLNRPDTYLVALAWGTELINSSMLITNYDSFLPQSKAKVSELNPLLLPKERTLAWNYLTLANPKGLSELREFNVDCHALLLEIAGDVCIWRGKEVQIGIVAENNPAQKSHERASIRIYPTKIRFQTESSGSGMIVEQDLSVLSIKRPQY